MIIKKINIEKYGKLKNFTINLNKGINVIYGENEAGKSTLQSFIKSMFYGMNSKKKHIKDNDRKKYLPWDESIAKGDIYYEYNGREYIIKRIFGATKKNDTIKIIDAITGKDINVNDKNAPGKDIFGLGEEAFLKTVFIKQMGSMVTRDKEDEIMGKLINLKQTGDENVSYYKAMGAIEKYQRQIENSRKTGKIDDLNLKYHKLQSELMEANKIHEESLDKQIKYKELIEQKNIVKDEIKNLEENSEKAKKLHIYNEYKEIKKYIDNINILSEKKESIEQKLKNEHFTVDINFVENIKEEYSKWIQIKKQIQEEKWTLQNNKMSLVDSHKICEELNKDILNKEEEIKNLNENADVNNQKIENFFLRKDMIKDKKNTFKFMGSIGGILVLSGALGAILTSKFLFVISIIGLIMCFYSIYVIKNNSQKLSNIQQKIDKLNESGSVKQKIDILNLDLKDLYSKLSYIKNKEINIKNLEKQENEKISIIQNRLSKAKNEDISINEVKQTIIYYINLISEKEKIQSNIVSCKNVCKALLKGRDFKEIVELVNDLNVESENNMDEESISRELKIKNETLFSIEKELVNTNNQIENAFLNCREKSIIEEDIKIVNEEIKKYKEYKEILNIASSGIEEAFTAIQSDFGPKLNEEVAEIMCKITKGKYDDVKISEDYSINLKDSKKINIKELDYFSSGTVDQLYFALRMGIIKLIFDKSESVPIFLDDAFVQYDDTRLKLVLSYILEYSKQNQVILSTCQKREAEYLRCKENVNVVNM